MFGPDMCGVEHKYHFIIRYRNPKTGVYSEHQAKKPTEPLDSYFTDKKSHLYTLGNYHDKPQLSCVINRKPVPFSCFC